ncbi:MAG: hypothetical protein KDC39_06040 [Actinobacteria bacterium]|nr:hypothetical protein [Actinomycetota bacterium]
MPDAARRPSGRRYSSLLGSVLLAATLLVSLLTVASQQTPASGAASTSQRADASAPVRLRDCRRLPWCTPSFLGWELRRAVLLHRKQRAKRLANRLIRSQYPNGRWGLGTAWGRHEIDFKTRRASDAESWEVAEVALTLLDYDQRLGSARALHSAERAAQYLRARVIRLGDHAYMAHMPDCNNLLQPHSTLAAAALLHHFPRHRRLAKRMKRSAVAMRWRRISPRSGETSLRHWQWATPVNDYERIQSAFYLDAMGDRSGRRLLQQFGPKQRLDIPRAQAYAVLVDLSLGKRHRARKRVRHLSFRPAKGYDLALTGWINTARRQSAAAPQ